jgi:hypothetical protein
MASTSVSHERAPSVVSSSSKLTAPGHATGSSLTRRLLFPHLPPFSPVPPLLQTSSTYPALDAELYDLVALALRAYINPWWIKITRFDKQLLLELTRIISSVLRAIETRALAVDLSPLIYNDLPTLLVQHCADYRGAARKLGSSYAAAGSASLPALFHGQQQHVGVSVDGKIDEVYVRAAVDIVLKACLSPEDWDAEAERYLIREVIVKTFCIDIAPRITQPWFLHSTLLGLLGPPDEPLNVSILHLMRDPSLALTLLTASQVPGSPFAPSNKYIIPTFIPHYYRLFSLCRPNYFKYRPFYNSDLQAHRQHDQESSQLASPRRPAPIAYSAALALISPCTGDGADPRRPTYAARSLPVSDSYHLHRLAAKQRRHAPAYATTADQRIPTQPRAPLAAPLLRTSLPARPVFRHSALLPLRRTHQRFRTLPRPVRIHHRPSHYSSPEKTEAETQPSPLPSLLPLFLYTSVLTPAQITVLISVAKHSLFPNGHPAQSPPDPTPEEQAVLRSELVRRFAQAIPGTRAPFRVFTSFCANENHHSLFFV